MTPVDQFLHSVQESFAENRATNWTKLGLLVFTVVALSVGLSVWMRRRRARRALEKRIHAVLSGAGLSSLDLGDLTRIAATGNLPLIDVMTVLASFEHATAALLAGETPTLPPVRGSWFERVRHLRHALGFSPLSRHLWLLTTRELVAGDSVAMRGINGRVAEVDEASFAVDWPAGIAPLVEGAEVNVTIDRVDDARYLARVRLLSLKSLLALAVESGDQQPGQRAFFAHDEQPERQQDREYSRLRVNVAVQLRIIQPIARDPSHAPLAVGPAATAVGASAPPAPPTAATGTPAVPPAPMSETRIPGAIVGTMIDVSAGGLSLHLPVSPAGALVRGAQVLCWFGLDHQAHFEGLVAAVVTASAVTGAPPGQQLLRLSFVALEALERDRLAAAVARHQGDPPLAAASGRL